MGARGDRLGDGGHLARRRALRRRPRARESARCGPDGPDLREPGGAERQPGSARRRRRHPGDLQPDGDERRGDGRSRRRRAHLRQDPRRGRRRERRPGARGRRAAGDGPRLGEQLRHRHGRRRDHERPRGDLDDDADAVEQQLLRHPLRLRVGAVEEPGRRAPVGGEGRRGDRPRPVRRLPDAPPDDAHDGPRAPVRPGLRADLAALPREPAGVRRRVREGVVQADAPRHGAGLAVPRPARPRGAAALAGPRPAGRARPDRPGGHGCSQGDDPRLGALHRAARGDGVGLGIDVPGHRQARRRQRGAHPPRPPERLGRQRARRPRHRAGDSGRDSGRLREPGLPGRRDRARRLRRRGAGGAERRLRGRGPVRPGAHGRVAGADGRGVVRGARADGGRVPQLPRERARAAGGAPARRAGEPADADGAGADRPRRRPPRAGGEPRRLHARRAHGAARAR